MNKRILIVEDNHIHRLLTEGFFEDQGYAVLGLQDGTYWLTSIADFQPDLILLDLKLPGDDGFMLLEQLRQSQWYDTPVFVVSAYTFKQEKQRAKDLGVRHYFTKPVNLEVLSQFVATEINLLSGRDNLS